MSAIPSPASLMTLFATEVYQTTFASTSLDPLIERVEKACRLLSTTDHPGQKWADDNGYVGYTSFDSHDTLGPISADFAELERLLAVHATIFAQIVQMDLRGRKLNLTRSWVNLLRSGGAHSGHIHPHSVISGTIYMSVPDGAGALQFEDPRQNHMMHAPMRLPNALTHRQPTISLVPARGTLFLWESWLRHEVPTNRSADERISISFNFDL